MEIAAAVLIKKGMHAILQFFPFSLFCIYKYIHIYVCVCMLLRRVTHVTLVWHHFQPYTINRTITQNSMYIHMQV